MPIHWFWIAALLLVVLIVFGPGRLPELGGAVGKAMREFRKATSELTNEVKASVDATKVDATKVEPPAATPAAPPAASTSSDSNTTN